MLGVFGGCTDEHDVAGLTVEGHQAGAVFLPAVTELTQHIGGVEITGRRLYAQGMEFPGFRESISDFRETRDNAATITVDTDRAAFPVALAGFIGMFQLAEQAVGHIVDAFVRMLVTQALDTGNETGPRPGFQVVEHRCWISLLSHDDLLRLFSTPSSFS